MNAIGKTDRGNIRELNEDYIMVVNKNIGSLPNVFVLADGMGGHNCGEVASRVAAESFYEYIADSTEPDILDNIIDAVSYANERVYYMSLLRPECEGMGTTFIAACISEDKLYIGYVGDSRVYALINGNLEQITTDHSYVMDMVRAGVMSAEEAKRSPAKNIITRAVGAPYIMTDGIVKQLFESCTVLICSDGLTDMVDDDDIKEILLKDVCIEEKADLLIEKAKENGGKDNISVILIEGVI